MVKQIFTYSFLLLFLFSCGSSSKKFEGLWVLEENEEHFMIISNLDGNYIIDDGKQKYAISIENDSLKFSTNGKEISGIIDEEDKLILSDSKGEDKISFKKGKKTK